MIDPNDPARRVFQSAPPVRGATWGLLIPRPIQEFQSAPPVRGATIRFTGTGLPSGVSIRAPRERGDGIFFVDCLSRFVSIRAPRERGDCNPSVYQCKPHGFNPRPP